MADTLDKTHSFLKNMVEHTNRGLNWSHNHNSPFRLSKLMVINFARTPQEVVTSLLQIVKTNLDNTMTHTIEKVNRYKYLGVVFNPKHSWKAHISKVIARAII